MKKLVIQLDRGESVEKTASHKGDAVSVSLKQHKLARTRPPVFTYVLQLAKPEAGVGSDMNGLGPRIGDIAHFYSST